MTRRTPAIGAETLAVRIPTDRRAILRSRPNRFLALIDVLDGRNAVVEREIGAHVHDPGRLEELLFPGNDLLLRSASGTTRRTRWDVVAARHDDDWILVHSGFHRGMAEWLLDSDRSPLGPLKDLRPEITVDHSRLDFVARDPAGGIVGIEVKGCTLARDGVALFPDAPTSRGTRHLETLIDMVTAGDRGVLLVLVLRPETRVFAPNARTDPAFAKTFRRAIDAGVEVHAAGFAYDGEWTTYRGVIPVLAGD